MVGLLLLKYGSTRDKLNAFWEATSRPAAAAAFPKGEGEAMRQQVPREREGGGGGGGEKGGALCECCQHNAFRRCWRWTDLATFLIRLVSWYRASLPDASFFWNWHAPILLHIPACTQDSEKGSGS